MANEEKITKFDRTNTWKVLLLGLFFAILTLFLCTSIFSLREKTDGAVLEDVHVMSITCESNNFFYPFFKFDNSTKKSIRVVATFGDERMMSISLQQMLYYDDNSSVIRSEAENHATMNILYADDGLEADDLNATYSIISNDLRFGLYSTFDYLDNIKMKYFLLDNMDEYDFYSVESRYESLFETRCITNN